MAPPPRTRTRGKKLPPGAGKTAAAKKASAIEKSPHVLEDPDNESVCMEVDQETADAKAWINENVEREVARIRSTGTNIEPLPVKNFGIVVDLSRKKATAINRIEINSSFDFKKVQQIMVSPGIVYPHKENFEYVNKQTMDPRKLKVNELKEQLQLAGLSVNGKKEELVTRLLEHLKAEEEAVNAGGPSTGAGDTFEWDESKFDVEYGH
ncbi:hypothetical protein BGX21_004213 [Mortierella sp. AD011]|nr:hypothetical protein BGX21_004213 [Mortierella sp. AD011]